MKHDELIEALRRLNVETGSLACLGCGHEHNCGTQGCAILREAIDFIDALRKENIDLRAELAHLRGLSKAAAKKTAEYIEREAALAEVDSIFPPAPASEFSKGIAVGLAGARVAISNLPTRIEMVDVVRCSECGLHEHCWTEDVFRFAGLDDDKRFCGVGKRMEEGNDGEHQPDTRR